MDTKQNLETERLKCEPPEIELDEKTQGTIRELGRVMNESQRALQLIMHTVLNCFGIKGSYQLSEDLTKLVKIPKKEEK